MERATLRQKKTGRPVRFEITEQRRFRTLLRPMLLFAAKTCAKTI
jgi:hypothetical protein